MKDKIEKDFIERNKDRDALSEEMIKELRAKGGDNMNGEAMAREKLGMEVADLSSRLNTKEINELIRKSKSGANMNKLLKGKGLTIKDIKQLEKIILKRN
jgi:hypothetical protein